MFFTQGGESEVSLRSTKPIQGQSNVNPRSIQGQSNVNARSVQGQSEVSPRSARSIKGQEGQSKISKVNSIRKKVKRVDLRKAIGEAEEMLQAGSDV